MSSTTTDRATGHTTASPSSRPGSRLNPVRAALALAGAELRLIWRNRTVALMALLFPLGLGAFVTLGDGGLAEGGAAITVMQVIFVVAFTAYATPATSLTTRRQDLFLKRLRSGELADRTILAGLLLPVSVLALVQVALLLAISGAAGNGLPSDPLLVVAALLLGLAMCLGAAVATSGFTPTAESAQITTLPFFLLLVGGSVASTAVDTDASWPLAVPGWALGRLATAGWSGDASFGSDVLPALVAQGVLVVLVWVAAGRLFRWDPRA